MLHAGNDAQRRELAGIAVQEMMASANLLLSLNSVLTQSAIELFLAPGSDHSGLVISDRLLLDQCAPILIGSPSIPNHSARDTHVLPMPALSPHNDTNTY